MRCAVGVWTFLVLAAANSSEVVAERVQFNRDIRPILAAKCFPCHGPDEAAREADLRLDAKDHPLGPFQDRDGEHVIRPGDLDASQLWQRVTSVDIDLRMPPPEAEQDELSEQELRLLQQWIVEGAEYEAFWAFVEPRPQSLPDVQDSAWSDNRIDRFVSARLDTLRATPQPVASRRTLIRRLSFDLTGLPPTQAELQAFVRDRSANAYDRLVDRLISSPRFGEHMARYWLDLVRFADTNGIHHDHYREMTPYRDWVIRAFNENLPFDTFVVDQVAGDLVDQPSVDQLIASGFNRLHLVIDKGTAIPEESFARNVIDRVTAFGTAFMGLTVGCAVCHDHKYDPLTQRDFYQLYAFFNNIDAGPETPGKDVHAPFLRLPNKEQARQLAMFSKQIERASGELDRLKADDEVVAESLQAAERRLKQLRADQKSYEATVPVSLIMKEREEVRPAFILERGAYDQPGARVERDTPGFLPPLSSTGAAPSRLDLARWLVDPKHPLTARVTVNRFWQQFFGVGLVRTSEDFGTQGEWPSHPELLDELAVQFVRSGWNVKQLVREIVNSQTYRQSSRASAAEFQADPQNRQLRRGSRFRLDAETIRDQILFVSGRLNDQMYGRSVRPPQPPGLWKTVSMKSSSTYSFQPDQGNKIRRRSLYSFWKRALPPPQMTIFDAPTREACIARRERTNTPLQALVLMNEEQYFLAARDLALTLLREDAPSEDERVRRLYELVTTRVPDTVELRTLREGIGALREIYQADSELVNTLTDNMTLPEGVSRRELAAYTMLVNSLFNLDITKTRE